MTAIKSRIPERLTFKKKEVIQITKLDIRVLEYWEKEFGAFSPMVNQSGEKFYSRQDLETILKIRQWLIVEKKEKSEIKSLLLKEGNGESLPQDSPDQKTMKNGDIRRIRDSLAEILTMLDKSDKK